MNKRMEQEMERTVQILQELMPEPKKRRKSRFILPQTATETAGKGARHFDEDLEREKRREKTAVRAGAAVAVFAAAVMCLAGFAFAFAASHWFSLYFTNHAGEELTPQQYRFLEEKSVGIGQSMEADGYTVTIDSAICDAQSLFLVIHIEGPEGVKLEFDPAEGNCFFDHVKYESMGTYVRTGDLRSFGRSWHPLDDQDGRENTVSLVMNDQKVLSADSNAVYTDGEVWRFQLADLSVSTGEFFSEKRLLAEGGWSFEFPLSEMSGEIEMISIPVICTAQSGGEGKEREPAEIVVTSFLLRPFSATCIYTYGPGDRPKSVDILEVQLEMRDGSTVMARPSSGGGAGGVGANGGVMSYRFDAPVMLEEVEYLVLPGEIRVPIPAQ